MYSKIIIFQTFVRTISICTSNVKKKIMSDRLTDIHRLTDLLVKVPAGELVPDPVDDVQRLLVESLRLYRVPC
jgi:hypothetical protein